MEYSYLTPQEQLAMLRPRLAEAERRHFDATLSAEAHPDESIAAQLTSIEAVLTFLHEEETRINDQIKKG
jgi:hypothetical protein